MIVLDTHAWIWWLSEPERLSAAAREALEGARSIGVSTVSCWELATKVSEGHLSLDRPVRVWVQQALARERTEVVPLTPEVAMTAAELSERGFKGDSADRLIAASSVERAATLVTRDARMHAFEGVKTVW
jgi:PIN domain nuclease of toxin-antitoxin system